MVELPDPPLVSDLYECVVFLSLFYIAWYIIQDYFTKRTISNTKNSRKRITRAIANPSNIDEIVSQNVPVIIHDSSLHISVIIPGLLSKNTIPAIEKAVSYFHNRFLEHNYESYEIIITLPKLQKNDAEIFNRIRCSNPNITLIEMDQVRYIGELIIKGIIQARGDLIFFAMPKVCLDIQCYQEFEDQLISIHGSSSPSIILGFSPLAKSLYPFYQTRLMSFCIWLSETIWSWIGIKGHAFNRASAMLMTRSAARQIIPNLHEIANFYDVEMVVIANKLGYNVCSIIPNVSPISAYSFPDIFIEIIEGIRIAFLHAFNIRKIHKV